MPRLEPLPESALDDLADALRMTRERLGFIPNSTRIMARRPDIVAAWANLSATIMRPGAVPRELKNMVSQVVSRAAGCNYCMAHTGHAGERLEIPPEKEAALWEFETSPVFSEAERAALRVALGAGQAPNAVTDADFEALRAHFDEAQIVELVAVMSMYGFLNRWNDTFATELESSPLAHGRAHLAQHGWDPSKHLPRE